MAQIINASIDLKKIDKSKIVTGKNGQLYYNITINVNDEENQWGQNVSIIQAQTKDDRDSKIEKIYIGNGKVAWTSENKQSAKSSSGIPKQAEDEFANDLLNNSDLPF